ncbi:hypothetical protein JCM6882_004617 [Rhodosporidiobolus microsporus]
MSASTLSLIWDGLKGRYGSVGLYGAVQRIFAAFGLLAGPGSLLTDAPFGRFIGGKGWIGPTVNGTVGWILMELCSPLSFLYFLSTPPSTSPFTFSAPSITRITSIFRSLPPARAFLAVLFLVHYSNRAVVGELRNPGRGRMHIVIPILSALFNLANGGTLGMYLAGGAAGKSVSNFGLKENSTSTVLFGVGVALWAVGFASNIYHDNVLFRLKEEKRLEREEKKDPKATTEPSPQSRYAIPQGGLYRFISHPSYTSEWVEWAGFTLATLALAPSPFPPLSSSLSLARLPSTLRPFQAWYLQPPAMFVLEEIAAMLPRARSGHRWYQKTFGQEWEEKGAKWVVIPGVY